MPAFLILLTLTTPAMAQDAYTPTAASRAQIGVTITYDPAYTALEFPGGDVDCACGVCTDVVIRALRDAWGIELQLAINREMKAHFAAYPKNWGPKTTDRNNDHRRVPNLQTLLKRTGAESDTYTDPVVFLTGDIVTYQLPGNLPHIAFVSDKMGAAAPINLHNNGRGAQE